MAVAVGHNEHPSAEVRGADVGGRKRVGTGSIAQPGEVAEDVRDPASRPGRDVFDDDGPGEDLSDDPPELVPEAGSGPGEPGGTAGGGHVLARESAAEDINGFEISGGDLCDIGVPFCEGPVLRQDGLAPGIDLDLPDRAATGRALQP